MNIKIKTKVFFRKKWGNHLTQEDLRGYRNILKLLYHPNAETPLKDPDFPKYYIQIPSLYLDLIIDLEKVEIINTTQIYPLNLQKEVLERAVLRIKEEVSKQRKQLEANIYAKKGYIFNNLYNKIKR